MNDEETLRAGAPLSLAELLPSIPWPKGDTKVFKCPVPGALKHKIKNELKGREVHEMQQEGTKLISRSQPKVQIPTLRAKPFGQS